MWWCPSHREGGRDSHSVAVTKLLDLYHPRLIYTTHIITVVCPYISSFSGWGGSCRTSPCSTAFVSQIPCGVRLGNHCHIATRPVSVLMSVGAAEFNGFLDQVLKRTIIKIHFHLESRKGVQCFCPVQARLEIPNHLIRELLISNYNNFWTCKPSLGSL